MTDKMKEIVLFKNVNDASVLCVNLMLLCFVFKEYECTFVAKYIDIQYVFLH